MIIVAVINFSPHLPTARALIKDLWRTEVKVAVGFPSNMTSFMMKRGRGRGVDTYTNFTINDTRLTVDTSEFMLIQGDKKYEIRFFANSKIILSVNLA